VKRASFRGRLLGAILGPAVLAAALLVALDHQRDRSTGRRNLENQLFAKVEEVRSALAAGHERLELESFLELETRYQATPYEYFYEIIDDQGRRLLTSRNLGELALGPRMPLDARGIESGTLAHPRTPGETVLVHGQTLPADVVLLGRPGPTVRVAVCLAPYEAALATELRHALIAAGSVLALLGAALWIAVGRSLRRVAEITRQASRITSHNLRERLPMRGSGDELDRLSAVLNDMLAGLERSLQQMEDFTSDAAHQLRTPLTRIRGELDLVLASDGADGELGDETRGRLGQMGQELERLTHTCARLLLLARLDRGALERDLCEDEIDLQATLLDLVEQVEPLALDKEVRVLGPTGAGARVRGSKALVVEAFLNLLDNAIRFTPPGGSVRVELRCQGGRALVAVNDDGPGVPEAERELVFRRFYRSARVTGAGGTGLGLAIVRGIARAHGGEVWLEHAQTGGASFRVSLPAA